MLPKDMIPVTMMLKDYSGAEHWLRVTQYAVGPGERCEVSAQTQIGISGVVAMDAFNDSGVRLYGVVCVKPLALAGGDLARITTTGGGFDRLA